MSDEDDFIKRFFFRTSNDFKFPQMNQPPDNHNLDELNNINSFIFHDMNRMFHEMDQMMKQFTFGINFGGFGSFGHGLPNLSDFDQDNNQVPAIENTPASTNKRDEFLKSNDSKSNDKSIIVLSQNSKSFFDNFFESIPFNNLDKGFNNYNQRIYDKFYEDENIGKEGLDKVLRDDVLKNDNNNKNSSSMNEFKSQNQQQPSMFSSFGQSYSIRRIQRPDGSVEEIKTIKNSAGNEEKTITRLIGDKKHSIIEKKENNVIKETEEIFENFDEKNLNDFNRLWNQHNQNNHQYRNPAIESSSNPGNNNDNIRINSDSKSLSSSILSKLYSWFR